MAGRNRGEVNSRFDRRCSKHVESRPYVRAKGWKYEALLDPNGDFKRALGVNLIPAAFVVDGKGKIAASRTGYTNGAEEHLIDEVRKLILK